MAENFDLIFGSNASGTYAWSDSDYQKGWEAVGSLPPTAAQFTEVQKHSDKKAQELNNALRPLLEADVADNRQPSTQYAEGDIKYSPLLPTGFYLTCTTAGITSANALDVPSPVVENDTITDGTVVWTIKKIGSADNTGDGIGVGIILQDAANGPVRAGYLLCDGSEVSRTMFADLFAAIGTTYGAGDGETTFNLPSVNDAKRFLQGDTVAGVEKQAGLPNIKGNAYNVRLRSNVSSDGALKTTYTGNYTYGGTQNGAEGTLTLDASQSNAIYSDNVTTVQPPALTVRYIIKAFDGQTADSALIDITQYGQELATKANRQLSNLGTYHRDVITTSGAYTAPATALYKVTVKGGGAGGRGSNVEGTVALITGNGGGEGGTTVGFIKMTAGDTANVVVGAGGAGGAAGGAFGSNGGNSSVTIAGNTLSASGGEARGAGGTGGIPGGAGGAGVSDAGSYGQVTHFGGAGGGDGGGTGMIITGNTNGTVGGGGAGGGVPTNGTTYPGGAGGDGYVWFEYFA